MNQDKKPNADTQSIPSSVNPDADPVEQDSSGGVNVYHVKTWEIGVVIRNDDLSDEVIDKSVREGHIVEASSEQGAIQQTVEYYRETEWDLIRFRYITKNLSPIGGTPD